ncbi:LamG-like jellyroll fold domain-containing protein [Atlantibacter sp.]|uniref:phage head spike fiber domain-containing protein n=1 Tax=Atlantibacter sp. TaxID=1903473 RepID=UPI0028ACB2A4|nr:LamG-like jellyroll fold domain-containing protein [Atlantibacter sp.]
MPYNTNNPVPSSDLRDFYDNTQTLDEVVNSGGNETTTRTGKKIATLSGLQTQVTQIGQSASQSAQQASQSAAAAAQSAAEAASSAAATGYVAPPFPDVWAPLSDSLQLLAGSSPVDTFTISGTSYPLKTKSLSFTRSSTATYIDKSGVLQTAAINEPRFEKEGLLIEGQSTNYFINTENPAQWKSTSYADSTVNITAVNDGNSKATTGVITTTAEKNSIRLIGNNGTTIPLSSGGQIYCSFRAKIPDGKQIRVRFAATAGGFQGGIYFSHDGVITLKDPIINGSVQLLSDGYIQASAYMASSASDAFYCEIHLTERVTSNMVPVGTVVNLQMPQVEPGLLSSYIPTAAAAVTRAADDCTSQRSGNDNYFGPVTIAAEVHCNGPTSTAGTANRRGIISIMPSNTEYVVIMVDNSSATLGKFAFAYGGSSFNMASKVIDDGNMHTVCARSNTAENQCSVDGEQLSNPTAVTRPTPGTVSAVNQIIMIGRGAGATAPGQRMLNGHIRNLRIWHRALSDIQMKGIR